MTKGFPFVFLLIASIASGENWPQWRGPHADGKSTESGIPLNWSQTENVVWRFPVESMAGSTPVVWDERIFLSANEGDDLVLIAVSTEGKQLWKKRVAGGNTPSRPGEGNSASASPSTDGKHVWVFFGTGDLACFTVAGEQVWNFNVQDFYGDFDIQFGMTSTPVLHENALYLQLIHGSMRGDYTVGKIVKLNKATGEEIWAVDRPSNATFECKHSYASPFLYDFDGQQFLVTHGADYTSGHSLEDGHELWRFEALNGPSQYNPNNFDPTFRFVSSPGIAPGTIVIPTAKAGPSVALKVSPALKGNVTENKDALRWHIDKTPDVSIPVIHDELVYFFRQRGEIFCHDLESGQELYFQRAHGFDHRSSALFVDGHFIWCAKDGHCTVLKAGPDYNVVAENEMGGEVITASPVVANGTLYIRTWNALYAIRKS